MDVKFYLTAALMLGLATMVLVGYVNILKPDGAQNQSMVILVSITSFLAGIIAFFYYYIGFKGDPTKQLIFLMIFTMLILFPMSILYSTLSVSQLYGLRNTLSALPERSSV
jgi:RsiW-degrading membrane proteinase PrsW (M82 family)